MRKSLAVIVAKKIGNEGCLKILQVVSLVTGKKVMDIVDFLIIRMIRKSEKERNKQKKKEDKMLEREIKDNLQPIVEDFEVLDNKPEKFMGDSILCASEQRKVVKEL